MSLQRKWIGKIIKKNKTTKTPSQPSCDDTNGILPQIIYMIKKLDFFSFQCVHTMRTFNELLWFAKELSKRQCVFKAKKSRKKRNLSMGKSGLQRAHMWIVNEDFKASKRSDSVTLLEHLVNRRWKIAVGICEHINCPGMRLLNKFVCTDVHSPARKKVEKKNQIN